MKAVAEVLIVGAGPTGLVLALCLQRYVADVEASGPIANHEINISMDTEDALAVMPMKGSGAARLVGQAPPNSDGSAIAWESVSKRLLQDLHTQVHAVRWFSSYRVHHRVAVAFRKGRALQPGRRPRHEYRNRRCGESGLEACRGVAQTLGGGITRYLRNGTHHLREAPGRNNRSGL